MCGIPRFVICAAQIGCPLKLPFTYYWNAETDSKGRAIGFLEGFQPGHKIQVAYRGMVDMGPDFHVCSKDDLVTVMSRLFATFNIGRPEGYRGPSMSVGSVVEIQGVCFAVESVGFKMVEIWESYVEPTPVSWNYHMATTEV